MTELVDENRLCQFSIVDLETKDPEKHFNGIVEEVQEFIRDARHMKFFPIRDIEITKKVRKDKDIGLVGQLTYCLVK